MERYNAIYLRVSSDAQFHRSQVPALTRWDAAQETEAKWFQDKFSGRTMDRPGWKELEAAILRSEVAILCVYKLDRLGRTTRGLLKLFDELREHRTTLISLTEGIDLATPAGRKFARDLASAAEYEREVIGERIRDGQLVAKAAGKKWGGGIKGVRRKVTPTQVSVIRQLYVSNTPVTDIARTVKLSRPTIYQVLFAEKLLPCG